MLGRIFLQETPNLSPSGETWMEKELEETVRGSSDLKWEENMCIVVIR